MRHKEKCPVRPLDSWARPSWTECVTMSPMKTITVRELHQATGRWVRRASAGEIHVTERGRLVAKI